MTPELTTDQLAIVETFVAKVNEAADDLDRAERVIDALVVETRPSEMYEDQLDALERAIVRVRRARSDYASARSTREAITTAFRATDRCVPNADGEGTHCGTTVCTCGNPDA